MQGDIYTIHKVTSIISGMNQPIMMSAEMRDGSCAFNVRSIQMWRNTQDGMYAGVFIYRDGTHTDEARIQRVARDGKSAV